jgi:hypothetical protein
MSYKPPLSKYKLASFACIAALTTGCDWDLLYNGSTEEISQGTRNSSPAPSSPDTKPDAPKPAATARPLPHEVQRDVDARTRTAYSPQRTISPYASTNNAPLAQTATTAATATAARPTIPINPNASSEAAAKARAGVGKQLGKAGKFISPVLKNPYVRGAGVAGGVMITGGALHNHWQDNIYSGAEQQRYLYDMDRLYRAGHWKDRVGTRECDYGENPTPEYILSKVRENGIECGNTQQALKRAYRREELQRQNMQRQQFTEQPMQQQYQQSQENCKLNAVRNEWVCLNNTGR